MKPRLLALSQCLPYPPHCGVTNRTFHIMRGLADHFDIRLLAFTRKNHQATAEEVRASCLALAALGMQVDPAFPIASERSGVAKLAVHAQSALTGRAYTYFDYGHRSYGQAIQTALREHRPDFVHMDSLDLHRWIHLLGDLPIACTHHSVESDLIRRTAQQERRAPLKAYLTQQVGAIEKVERSMCPRVSLNVMMSEVDAARLRELAPSSRTFVAPNGVDIEEMRPLPNRVVAKGRISFLAPSHLLPNRDGAEFFLRDVWPIVRAARPDATFQLIGKVSDGHRSRFESFPGVTCTGFVPDLQRYLAESECCVVPLRIGGGTRLKILDAWAMGRPVISTSIGCEGLATEDGGNILIRDTPAGLAEAILGVLGDRPAAETIGAAGRQTAEDLYSWDAIGHSLAQKYLSMLGHSQDPSQTDQQEMPGSLVA